MAEIVNLRQARKRKRRDEKEARRRREPARARPIGRREDKHAGSRHELDDKAPRRAPARRPGDDERPEYGAPVR